MSEHLDRVLLLGAGDLLACRVRDALAAAGHAVTVVNSRGRLMRGKRPSRFPGEKAGWAELGSAAARHDVVINLDPVMDEPCGSLRALMNRPRGHRRARRLIALDQAMSSLQQVRWIQRSTPALYADGGSCWVNESWPLAVNRATMHAYAAECAVNRHTRQGGIGIALRLARLYGPGDPWTAKVLSLAAKGWQAFDGPEDAFVPLASLDAAVSAVLAALKAPAGVYNIADPAPRTNGELNSLLAGIGGHMRLHPLWPSLRAADRDLTQRSHRLDVSAFTAATGRAHHQLVPTPRRSGLTGPVDQPARNDSRSETNRERPASGWSRCT